MLNFILLPSKSPFHVVNKNKINRFKKTLITQQKKSERNFFFNYTSSFSTSENQKTDLEPEIWEIDFFSKPVLNEKGKKTMGTSYCK